MPQVGIKLSLKVRGVSVEDSPITGGLLGDLNNGDLPHPYIFESICLSQCVQDNRVKERHWW